MIGIHFRNHEWDVGLHAVILRVAEHRAPGARECRLRIARALSDLDLDVRHATVATYGHEVVDSFYVCDGGGRKLDPELAREVERAVLLELSRV